MFLGCLYSFLLNLVEFFHRVVVGFQSDADVLCVQRVYGREDVPVLVWACWRGATIGGGHLNAPHRCTWRYDPFASRQASDERAKEGGGYVTDYGAFRQEEVGIDGHRRIRPF